MNDDDLRQLLEGAVRDVHPSSRLDSVLGSEPPSHRPAPRRMHQSGVRIVAFAAVLLALVAGSLAVLRKGSTDAPVASDGGTTTSTTTAPPVPTLGDQVQVPVADLPAGWVQVDERADSITYRDDVYDGLIATFAAPGADVAATDVPMVRVAWLPSRTFVSAFRDIVEILGGPRPDYQEIARVPDQSWQMPTGTEALLPQLPGTWITIGVAHSPDELLLVQGRGIDLEDLRTIAAETVIRT